jgi:diguanylate cyclase (GGDEF)-like protein
MSAPRTALERLRRRLVAAASERAFALRLMAAIAATFCIIAVLANVLIADQIEQRQLDSYARTQIADVESFESVGRTASSPDDAVDRVKLVIDAVGRRPGTLEALLIDPQRLVRASGADPRAVGDRDTDARIEAAFREGTRYAGHEADPGRDHNDLEFVAPVALPGGRYVFEVSYDGHVLDAQLNDIRRTIALCALLALLVGGVVFYVVGGRPLMRAHRTALQRAILDGLTDLPNQRAFQDELERAVTMAARHDVPLALALLDLDDFKYLNDRHGHAAGDVLLRRIAAVLRAGRAGDRAYRVGGDEFALLLPHTDAEGASALGRRLTRALADDGAAVSIGISVLRAGARPDTLRAEADAAVYEAKRRGGNGFALFDEIRDSVVITTADQRETVHRLIDAGAVTTVFQPIWNLATGRLLGFEALGRPDPTFDLSGPAEAFDVAEQIGRVHELDVLCACSALRRAAELPADALLFLNLAPQTLDLDADDNDWLKVAVLEVGLPLERVVVEVTERFGGRTASVVKCLERLRSQGFQLALDDVGTGNAGLEMLRKVGAEFVKIDRSIVAGAATEPNARAVLIAMASFASQTGSFVIAEGIEDEETLAFLRDMDDTELRPGHLVHGGQGYGLGRPAPQPSARRPSLLGPDRLVQDGPRAQRAGVRTT